MMKPIDRILLQENLLEPNALPKYLAELQKQIEYHASCELNTAGISLLPVRDHLSKYTDDYLRSRGYILNISDFMKACEATCRQATKDPILYNSQLKRLHYAYTAFINHYLRGRMHNSVAKTEMTKIFSKAIREAYRDNNRPGLEMPKELMVQITELLATEIEKIVKKWLTNKQSTSLMQEITGELSKKLLHAWQQGALPPAISRLLEEEKSKNNTTASLLTCFREKRLPASIQQSIQTAFIREISDGVESGKIDRFSPLGRAIKYLEKVSLKKKDYGLLIEQWQKSSLRANVVSELETYVTKVIANNNLPSESSLDQQFARLATDTFIEKARQEGIYSGEITDLVYEFALDLCKEKLSCDNSTTELAACRDQVYEDAMLQLHELWLAGKLPNTKNQYLEYIVLKDLREMHSMVTGQIWLSNTVNVLKQKEVENEARIDALEQTLSVVVNELKSLKKSAIISAKTKIFPIGEEERQESDVAKTPIGFFSSSGQS